MTENYGSPTLFAAREDDDDEPEGTRTRTLLGDRTAGGASHLVSDVSMYSIFMWSQFSSKEAVVNGTDF